jgi:mRNA interferase MazF
VASTSRSADSATTLDLSPADFNDLTGYVFVAPVTSTRRDWPFEVPIPPGGKVSGAILTDQTKSIDYVARHVAYLAASPPGLIEAVLERLEIILLS